MISTRQSHNPELKNFPATRCATPNFFTPKFCIFPLSSASVVSLVSSSNKEQFSKMQHLSSNQLVTDIHGTVLKVKPECFSKQISTTNISAPATIIYCTVIAPHILYQSNPRAYTQDIPPRSLKTVPPTTPPYQITHKHTHIRTHTHKLRERDI